MEQEQVKNHTTTHSGSVEHSKKQSSDKFWKVTTVVLIVVLAFLVLRNSNGGTSGPTGGAAIDQPAAPTGPVDVSLDDDPMLGQKDAPVTIVEFSDYQCPFCGRFYSQTLPQIKSKYIDTGKVRLVFRDFPLSFHPEALPAAVAANCAGTQGKYYEYHNKVFENQAVLSTANYKKWAQELGLDTAKWETCTKDPKQQA